MRNLTSFSQNSLVQEVAAGTAVTECDRAWWLTLPRAPVVTVL